MFLTRLSERRANQNIIFPRTATTANTDILDARATLAATPARPVMFAISEMQTVRYFTSIIRGNKINDNDNSCKSEMGRKC